MKKRREKVKEDLGVKLSKLFGEHLRNKPFVDPNEDRKIQQARANYFAQLEIDEKAYQLLRGKRWRGVY